MKRTLDEIGMYAMAAEAAYAVAWDNKKNQALEAVAKCIEWRKQII